MGWVHVDTVNLGSYPDHQLCSRHPPTEREKEELETLKLKLEMDKAEELKRQCEAEREKLEKEYAQKVKEIKGNAAKVLVYVK